MIIKTSNSVYEVRDRTRRFRRVRGRGQPDGPPKGEWRQFDRRGPVVRGRPVQFFWLREAAGRSARVEILTTAPVAEVVGDAVAVHLEVPGT